MKYIIKDTSIVVTTDNYKIELPKNNFSKLILNEDILAELSFSELQEIWKNLYGIPKNIKDILKKKIELYNTSLGVKYFNYKDTKYWLDKNNRNSLWILGSSSLGNVEIVLGDNIVNVNSLKLKAFLLKLEVYSYKCFVNTHRHLQNIKELKLVEDILNYDYTQGYPDKLKFDEYLDLA